MLDLSSHHCETIFFKRKSLKPYLLNVVNPGFVVVFYVPIFGRAQDEKKKLFNQKNAASAGMKKSCSTVSGILK